VLTAKVAVAVDQTLKDAHRLLQEGRVEGAIAAYARVLEARPDDWPTANRLGDLYVQTGKIQEAVEQFRLVAQQLRDRHLLSKAAALYKKVLKVAPEDDHARMQLAEIAEQQGFLTDARTHLTAVAERRRRAGDDQGVLEVENRIERVAKTRPGEGTAPGLAKRRPEGADQWKINKRMMYEPGQADGSPNAAPANGPADAAEPVASRPDPPADDHTSGEAPPPVKEESQPTHLDPQLQLKLMLIENEIRAGRLRRARRLVGTVLADDTDQIVDLAKRMTGEQAEATVMCAEAIVDTGQRHDNWEVAAGAVRELAVWVPAQPAGREWPPELLQRLARADAAARLETMRRERAVILQTFPDLMAEGGGQDSGLTDPSGISTAVAGPCEPGRR